MQTVIIVIVVVVIIIIISGMRKGEHIKILSFSADRP